MYRHFFDDQSTDSTTSQISGVLERTTKGKCVYETIISMNSIIVYRQHTSALSAIARSRKADAQFGIED